MTEPRNIPAGWYADPTVPGAQRYWDGSQWTEHVQPPPPPRSPAKPVGGTNYVVAFLIPIIGIVMAISRYSRGESSQGTALLVTSILAFFVWAALLASSSS